MKDNLDDPIVDLKDIYPKMFEQKATQAIARVIESIKDLPYDNAVSVLYTTLLTLIAEYPNLNPQLWTDLYHEGKFFLLNYNEDNNDRKT